MLSEGLGPQQIVAFTFTERAASELRIKIETAVLRLMGESALHRLTAMFVGTIHAFCYRFLQDNVPQYADYEPLNEHQTVALVSREFERLGLARLGHWSQWKTIDVFLDNVGVVENELIAESKLQGAFSECYKGFREMLQSYRALTFGQMIVLAVEQMQRAEVRSRLAPLRHLIH